MAVSNLVFISHDSIYTGQPTNKSILSAGNVISVT